MEMNEKNDMEMNNNYIHCHSAQVEQKREKKNWKSEEELTHLAQVEKKKREKRRKA